MFSIKYIKLAALVLTLAFASTALAQESSTATPQASPAPRVPNIGLKNRIFEIKYGDPNRLVQALRLLSSEYGAMLPSLEYRTITVRDFPENIATIEEAIKRLDVPSAPTPSIEFHVHILIATNAATTSNQFPLELNDVVKQLKATLNYKDYYLMTSAVLRTNAGPQGIANSGVANFQLTTEGAARNNPIFYKYEGSPVGIGANESGASMLQIGKFRFSMSIPVETSPGKIDYEPVGFETPVSMREGEKIVVGTTTMQDKGVILVLSAKIIR